MENRNGENPGTKLAQVLITVFVADIAAISIALTAKLIQWMLF